jgi:peptide-methionine (S)-S-oxide reductase
MMDKNNMKTAVFGGGCFWCTEAIFSELKGVLSVMPGYAGGAIKNPTYESVSGGTTGHAEVTKIDYDPKEISYEDLLTVFFYTHDPTTLNRQGADIGEQYRSIILYASEDQKNKAEEFIKELRESKAYDKPIVTEVKPLGEFYEAEEHHRNYYKKNANAPYCQLVIAPKLEKLEKRFGELLRKSES